MKSSSIKKLRNFVKVSVIALASFSLAACSNNNSQKSGGGTAAQSSKSIADKAKNAVGVGTVSDHPTNLADFTATVKAAGYEIISGTDSDGNQISGATKDSDGMFYVNVKVGNEKGHIVSDTENWLVSFHTDNVDISDGGTALPTATEVGL
jgi:predicted small secreted protein